MSNSSFDRALAAFAACDGYPRSVNDPPLMRPDFFPLPSGPRQRMASRGMSLQASFDGHRCVVRLTGLIKLGESAEVFANALERLELNTRIREVILDFADIDYVDSTGIGELVSYNHRLAARGRHLYINRPTVRVLKILRLAKLNDLLFTDEDYTTKDDTEGSDEPSYAARHQPDSLSLALVLRHNRLAISPVTATGMYRIEIPGRPETSFLIATPHVIAAYTRAYLADQICQLEELINWPRVKESDLQRFLDQNPDFILGREYERAIPQVVLEQAGAEKLIPDFFLKPFGSDLCDLLELKLPTAPVIVGRTNRRRFSSAVAEAIAQLRTYSGYFDDRANREMLRRKRQITAFRPRLSVVIGRRPAVEPVAMRSIVTSTSDVTVLTYDDLIEHARRFAIM